MGKFEENQRKMFEIEPNTYLGAHEDTNITKSAEQRLPKKNVKRIQRIGSQKQRPLFKKGLLVFSLLATIFTPKYSPTSPYFAYHAKPFPSALSGLPCLYRFLFICVCMYLKASPLPPVPLLQARWLKNIRSWKHQKLSLRGLEAPF